MRNGRFSLFSSKSLNPLNPGSDNYGVRNAECQLRNGRFSLFSSKSLNPLNLGSDNYGVRSAECQLQNGRFAIFSSKFFNPLNPGSDNYGVINFGFRTPLPFHRPINLDLGIALLQGFTLIKGLFTLRQTDLQFGKAAFADE